RDYAYCLADEYRDRIGRGSLQDVLLEIRSTFNSSTGFKMSVFSLSPLTMVFEGDAVMRSKMDMHLDFIGRTLENATGDVYIPVRIEDFGNSETCRFKVTMERGIREPEPYVNLSLNRPSAVDRFVLVDLDGTVTIVTNENQIEIMEAVYERPLCVTDIVSKTDSPRSTVTVNMLKMVEDGILSVFYTESGTAYYGLSCSILMKRTRQMDPESLQPHSVLSSVAQREGTFMEGYLLYTLSALRSLGFDTDYLMVVLGAKYMRAAGRDDPKDFDIFFGKMSDIAKTIGLSLNVASVYPLTIGITSDDPDSQMYPAMTFIKGMAHQGLEMAGNGMFVRVSDDSPEAQKVSFKEIYPALSLTPAEGVKVDGLADEAPAIKKRTSSVKVALRNRNSKSNDRPRPSVRYITGIAALALLVVVVAVGMGVGEDTPASGDTFTLYADSQISGATFTYANGEVVEMPLEIAKGTEITIVANMNGVNLDLGFVGDGCATRITDDSGYATLTMDSDKVLRQVFPVDMGEGNMTVEIYDYGTAVPESKAYDSRLLMSAEDYVNKTGGMWISSTGVVRVTADEGYYLTAGGDTYYYLDKIVMDSTDLASVEAQPLPESYVTLTLKDIAFEIDGRYVTGQIRMSADAVAKMRFVSTDGPVRIIAEDEYGEKTVLDLDRDRYINISASNLEIEYQGIQIA
ncbi:MAG: winged helix-turn-helix transcriptional regulator, partial [Candidatus Methanomethylophilaceae archaeon]|nr:winged helix-turn-helix transcriptional regulator [Candidatus Methanomethylophilaceae archaeon]